MNSISILGCGWLGEPLAYHFLKKDYTVKGSSRNLEKLKRLSNKGVEVFNLTCDMSLVHTSFFDVQTLVICLTNKNIEVAKRIISVIEQSQIQNVLFISSTSVYKAENKLVTENSPLVDSPLVTIEGLFQEANFRTTIVRFAGLVGGERHPGRFFSKGNELKSPNAPINLIHLEDCIQVLDTVVCQNKWGEIYNGCSSTHPLKGDFYTKSAIKGDFNLPIIKKLEGSVKTKTISNEKILKGLGVSLVHPDLSRLYH